MPVTKYYGATKIQHESEITFNRFGLATGSITLLYPYSATGISFGGKVGDSHPVFPWLTVETKSIRRGGPWLAVTLGFVGIQGQMTEPIWRIKPALSQEPIQTWDKFEDLVGTPSGVRGRSGSLFNPDGSFKEFDGRSSESLSSVDYIRAVKMRGVSSYLAPGGEIERRYMTSKKPVVKDVGRIAEGFKPPIEVSTGPSSNWLIGAPAIEQRGKVFDVTENWLLSGPLGWNTILYGKTPYPAL